MGLPKYYRRPFISDGQRFYYPPDFEPNMFYDKSPIPALYNRTYLGWDYETEAAEDRRYSTLYYDSDNPLDTDANHENMVHYGPSSPHGGMTQHLFVDGSVHALDNSIDVAAYFFLITRAGGDPIPPLKPD